MKLSKRFAERFRILSVELNFTSKFAGGVEDGLAAEEDPGRLVALPAVGRQKIPQLLPGTRGDFQRGNSHREPK